MNELDGAPRVITHSLWALCPVTDVCPKERTPRVGRDLQRLCVCVCTRVCDSMNSEQHSRSPFPTACPLWMEQRDGPVGCGVLSG